MDLLPLLCPVARLLDLHDSDRGMGGPPAFVREERTGEKKGTYLDIAVLVLRCLRELDERASQDYLPFLLIFEYVGAVRNAEESDVLFVLNVLRRPTELWYLDRSADEACLRSESRKTVLVEKTDYADEYRLSPTGRTVHSLATAARDAAYLKGDAFNLLQAIEWRDFGKIVSFAAEISTRLRIEILEIRRTLERIGALQETPAYVSRFEQYQKMIEETVTILRQAERELIDPDALDAFLIWAEQDNLHDLSFEALRQSVLNVRRTLTVFNRLMSELVTAVLQQKRSAVRPVDFLAMAAHLVRMPPTPQKRDFFLQQWGALQFLVPGNTFADCAGTIKVRAAVDAQPQTFDETGSEEVSQIGRLKFMNAYGLMLAERLHQGPMLLSEALDEGYFEIDGELFLGDLVGTFVAPDSLPLVGQVSIRLAHQLTKKDLGVGCTLLYSDIELCIVEEPLHEQ